MKKPPGKLVHWFSEFEYSHLGKRLQRVVETTKNFVKLAYIWIRQSTVKQTKKSFISNMTKILEKHKTALIVTVSVSLQPPQQQLLTASMTAWIAWTDAGISKSTCLTLRPFLQAVREATTQKIHYVICSTLYPHKRWSVNACRSSEWQRNSQVQRAKNTLARNPAYSF